MPEQQVQDNPCPTSRNPTLQFPGPEARQDGEVLHGDRVLRAVRRRGGRSPGRGRGRQGDRPPAGEAEEDADHKLHAQIG